MRFADIYASVYLIYIDIHIVSSFSFDNHSGEEIIERGSISSDLFLLVGGIVEVKNPDRSTVMTDSIHSESDLRMSIAFEQ